ncbi:putative heme d1 biosynthesis radical SAM protein NirJ1 [Halonatronum saccharophilum]|uniref:putative heme d1 biosynthesis radical SAM protein NirJ1 n=1 Tax=Halonatronum saccharophilum TaxID=150060 RepID=UPI000489D12E|nr:putative heme d1 biosynthesis radical SAM protein NirJ1 [Halonatronum saccharophilum]
MIGISKLLGAEDRFGDRLRYHKNIKSYKYGVREGRGPVVVWNATRSCNLNCIHCYSNSKAKKYRDELNTEEAKDFIDDLANFNVPVLLISGGEPLMRDDIFELIEYARSKGLRVTLSTNGTMITEEIAKRLKRSGISYVGISLDGIGEENDRFRGKEGAFDEALKGIRNCKLVDQKVGLRFTINRHNYESLEEILRLIEEENIPRACFYHLVYSGRGSEMIDKDISHQESREVLDLLIAKVLEWESRGVDKEILTVDNHCDGIYLYLKLKEVGDERTNNVLELLKRNRGNRSGIAIANVDWQGRVHPDQFTQDYIVGNIKEKPFSQIWMEDEGTILEKMRDRKRYLKGRCSGCRWIDICNGNFRPRAEAIYNDFWAEDPACYLSDEEIGS